MSKSFAMSPTFETVNAHVDSVDLTQFRPGGPHHVTGIAATGALVLPAGVCAAYQAARPIIQAVASAFFLPLKWRQVLQIFLTALDAICPASP